MYTVLRLTRRGVDRIACGLGIRFPEGKSRIFSMCRFEAPCLIKGSVNLKTYVRVGVISGFMEIGTMEEFAMFPLAGIVQLQNMRRLVLWRIRQIGFRLPR